MAVKLRLKRQGRRNAPHYAIVAADTRAPRDGRFIEKVGFYNPRSKPAQVHVDEDIVLKWLKNGAQPTDTVRAILRHAGINLKFALIKQGKSEEQIERIYSNWWNEKTGRTKKMPKFLLVDRHGSPLMEVPVFVETVKEKKAPVVEEAPAVEELAAKAETAAEEVVADAKETVEAAPEKVEAAAEEVVADAKETVEEAAKEETKDA